MRTVLGVCVLVALVAPFGFGAPACDCVLKEDEQSCLLGHLIDVINKLINCQKQPKSCLVEDVESSNNTKIETKEETTPFPVEYSTTNTKGPVTSTSLQPSSTAYIDHEYITTDLPTTPEVASSTTMWPTDEHTWSSSNIPTSTPEATTSIKIHDNSNSSPSTEQNPFLASSSSTTATSTPISSRDTATQNCSSLSPATQEVPIATSKMSEFETTPASATSLAVQLNTNHSCPANHTSTSTPAPSATISRKSTVTTSTTCSASSDKVTKKPDFIFIPVMKVDDDTKPFDLVQVLKCLLSRDK